MAAVLGLKDIAELLLKNGANVNAQDKEGRTPLYQAVERRQPEVVELLLANKADPNVRDNHGRTALDLAKSMAQGRPPSAVTQGEAMVALLLPHGAVEDLPQPDQLIVQRHATGYSQPLLIK